MNIIEKIKKKAQASLKIIVLPESYDERMLYAAEIIEREKIAKVVMLGNPETILAEAVQKKINLSGVELLNPATSSKLEQYVEDFTELRKSKGMTREAARLLLTSPDNLYYAGMMVRNGDAAGEVAGAANSTGNVFKAAFQAVGTTEGTNTVSSFFMMVTKNPNLGEKGIILFSDCAVNPNPDAQALAEIAIATAINCKTFLDVDARVALLSFSTKGSAKHSDCDKVIKALEIVRQLRPDLHIDGELQLDAALVPEIGASKAPGSSVAGKANVLVFPTLDAANIGYKLVERIAGADAVGPVTQGLAKPVNDLSRGCTVENIVNVTAITAVQAASC